MATWDISSSYVRGFARALRKRNWLTPAFEKDIGEAAATMLREHFRARWWNGGNIEKVGNLILDRAGPDELVELGILVGHESVGAIVGPLVSVILSLSGAQVSALLRRMPDVASTTIRHVELDWRDLTPLSGQISFKYPEAVPRIAEPLWRAGCLHLLQLAKTTGRVSAGQIHGTEMVITVEWERRG